MQTSYRKVKQYNNIGDVDHRAQPLTYSFITIFMDESEERLAKAEAAATAKDDDNDEDDEDDEPESKVEEVKIQDDSAETE